MIGTNLYIMNFLYRICGKNFEKHVNDYIKGGLETGDGK